MFAVAQRGLDVVVAELPLVLPLVAGVSVVSWMVKSGMGRVVTRGLNEPQRVFRKPEIVAAKRARRMIVKRIKAVM